MRNAFFAAATGLAALVAVSGTALGGVLPVNGDIIFTSQQDQAIKLISGFGPSVASTLYTFSDPGDYPAGIAKGFDGQYYVSRGRLPIPNAGAGIVRVNDLFGSPSETPIATGDPLQNPAALMLSPDNGRLLTVSNPGGAGSIRGIYDVSTAGAVSTIANEVPSGVGYHAGFGLTKDPNSSDFFVSALNGGAFQPMTPDGAASTLWRMSYNVGPDNYSLGLTPLVDFTDILGPGQSLTNIRGIAAIPGTSDIYAADFVTESIYKITLDGLGNFSSIAFVAGGFDEPENIMYNPWTNKLVIDERGGLTSSVISQINLDGTGYEVLASGDHARGFYIVPTPAGLALLPIAGLFAARRRRA